MNEIPRQDMSQEQKTLEKMNETDSRFYEARKTFWREPYYLTYKKRLEENDTRRDMS